MKSIWQKSLLLLIVTLYLLVLPALPASASDSVGDEVVELRTQYSNTFNAGNGAYMTRVGIGSINYETIDGGFYPIQTNILSSDKPNWDWEVEAGHWQLYIKNDTTIGVRKWDNWVGHRLYGIAYLDVSTKEYEIIQTVYERTPLVAGNEIKWEDLLYGVDYIIRYTNDSLKEDIIIKQSLRDILNQSGRRPADYGLNTATTYLVPIFEMDWSRSLPMKLRGGKNVSPDNAEHAEAIYFESPVKDKYFNTNLVSYMPLDYAVSANPINPEDPEEDWEYASAKIRKRLITKNDKHWLLMGVPVLTLNQMPEGDIIFDPTETLRPNAAGSETSISTQYPASDSHYDKVDEASADDATTYVQDGGVGWQRDLYDLPASSGSGTINHITVYFRCASDDAMYTGFAKPSIKSNSTVTDGTEVSGISNSWTTYSQQWSTNPADSEAWEWADIDALQIGVSLKEGGDNHTRCTQVYVEVDYIAVNPPTVTTQAATNVEATTATGNGNITAIGGENCDRRGIVWDLATHGDPGNVAPGASGYANDKGTNGDFGVGAFTESLTGLPTGDTIYARAYAHNSQGYDYGVEVNFLTKPAPPTYVAATDGVHTDKVVITWTKSTGATDYQVYQDGGGLGWIGDVATHDDNTADAPTITPGAASASDGTDTAHVVLSLAGESTSNGTTHTYKVRAKNATGESGDSATDNGYRSVGALTYQWQRSAGDGDAGYGNIGGATTDPYDDIGAPAGVITPGTASSSDGTQTAHVVLSLAGESVVDGAGRWYRCVLDATGAAQQISTTNRGYRTTGALTYQWQRSAADSNAAYGNIGGATTDPYNDVGAPQPTITPGTATASDGTDTAHVTLSIAGESANTFGRYYKCVLNATGTTQQTSTNDRGYRGVGALTYQWQRSAGDGDAGYGVLGGATTDPYNDTTAPASTITPGLASASDGTDTGHITLDVTGESVAAGAGRWYYCEVSATGAVTQDTTHNRGYRGTGAITYQWQRSNVDGDAGYGPLGGATSDPYNDSTAPAGVITPGTISASDGTDRNHVVLTVAGHSVADGTGRWYYCEISSPDAVMQDTTHNRGYRTTGAITFQMQRSAADSDAAYGNIGGATTNPYNDTGAPADGSGRWYLGKLDATGTAQAETTHDRGFRLIVIPTVTTQAASSINENSAIGNGNITDTGGPNCDERGFDYDVDSGVPYADSATDVGSYGTGAYTKGLVGLNPGTLYYYRAKAHNSVGWGYGSEETFYTYPSNVTGFSITATTDFIATLVWTNGTGGDKTMVRYKIGSYPANIGDGTQAYFDTASTVTVSGLTPGEHYYFSAWAHDSDSGLYSSGVAQDEDYTRPGILPSLSVSDKRIKTDSEVDISWVLGVGGDITVIRQSIGGYPASPADGDLVYSGIGSFATGNFTGETTYYSGWAYDSSSSYYSISSAGAKLIVLSASERVGKGLVEGFLPLAIAAFVVIIVLASFSRSGSPRQLAEAIVGAVFAGLLTYYVAAKVIEVIF